MKSICIIIIAVLTSAYDETYHYAVKDIYNLGNQIRGNPGKTYSIFKNEDAQKFVYSQYKSGNLTWSPALALSC
jgi:hypothetical protein